MTLFHSDVAHNSSKLVKIPFDCKRIKWQCGEVRRGAERSTRKDLCMKYSIQCADDVSEHEDIILNGSCTNVFR
jgi:hypothetical protein